MPGHAHAIPFLADSDSPSGDVLIWSVVLILFVLAAFVAIMFLRKKLSPDEDFHGEGFTLGDFRRLVKAGKMSPEEFERAKAALLAGISPTTASPPPDDLPGNRSLRSEK